LMGPRSINENASPVNRTDEAFREKVPEIVEREARRYPCPPN